MTPSASLANIEQALVDRLRTNKLPIPPYPAVATKLEKLARDPRHTVAQLAEVVAQDPSLAAAVVGRANSAANGRPVTSLAESLQRIGVEQVIQVALAMGLGKASTAGGPLGVLRRNTWRCALLAARFAQELATKRGVSPDAAYLAGLLHDFGAVVLVAGIEEIGQQVPLPMLPEAQWQAFVTKLQVQVGMAVAARWNLPEAITDVIAHHHEAANVAAPPLTQLIKIVDRVIAILDRSPGTGVAALLELPEIATMERYTLGAAAQEVGAQMASLSAAAEASTAVADPARADEEAWPVAFEISVPKHEAYAAVTISPNTFEMVGKEPLAPAWLVEVTLGCMPSPLKLLVNVKTCEPCPEGHRLVLAPFALGGDLKKQWLALLDSARVSLEDVA
ncbi:MAG TPA: HDOD domain-containing protein [Kofleriaceae bacterium]|nr:HDOD domain-containing protein [Kofleriaceae bacterium]